MAIFFKSALNQSLRVIIAITLRDIKTRIGNSYFGFVLGLAMPMGHMIIILLIYYFSGRKSAIGTDTVIYLSSAILPFILWSYTHQKIMISFNQNSALTFFPIVRYDDILIARSIVEFINCSTICFIFYVLILLISHDHYIYDYRGVFFSLFSAYILGVSTGSVFGILTLFSNLFFVCGYLIIPLYWITSGVFFIPESLPKNVRYIIDFLPLSHIVDETRRSIYSNYNTEYPNIIFVYAVLFGNFFLYKAIEITSRTQRQ